MTKLDDALDLHRKQLLGCRRCGHADVVRPIVSLARAPRAMLIGQAPGITEAEGGRPFAGRAGKTLFKWLATAGIAEAEFRERVYIAAVTRCYPGRSPAGRGDRVPTPRERAECAGWLGDELQLIRPRLVIPVGRLAIDAVLGPLPLDAVIGREFDRGSAAGDLEVPGHASIVALPHPSGASSWIHQPGHRQLLEAALALIGKHWTKLHARRRVA